MRKFLTDHEFMISPTNGIRQCAAARDEDVAGRRLSCQPLSQCRWKWRPIEQATAELDDANHGTAHGACLLLSSDFASQHGQGVSRRAARGGRSQLVG